LTYSTLSEDPGDILNATAMVTRLVDDHEEIIVSLRVAIDTCTDDFHDAGNADFFTGQMEQHESMAWMLRSFIEGDPIQSNGQIPSSSAVGIPIGV
jgi:starvation-inducible DNA-binding protein